MTLEQFQAIQAVRRAQAIQASERRARCTASTRGAQRLPRIEFVTSEYEFSHGRLPRGRGSWAFQLSFEMRGEYAWSPSMTFAEARRWVVAQVRARLAANPLLGGLGTVFVEVQP